MLAAGLPGVVDLRLSGEPGRADARVGEIDVARLGAEETRATGDVGDADEHVAGHAVVHRPAGLRHGRADRRIDDRAGRGAAGVHLVRGPAVLVDHVVVHRADESEAVEQRGTPREVLADLHAGDRRGDGVVVAACLLGGGIPLRLRIPGVDLGGTAAEPDEDAVLGLAERPRTAGGGINGAQEPRRLHGREAGGGRAGEEAAAGGAKDGHGGGDDGIHGGCLGAGLMAYYGTNTNSGALNSVQARSSARARQSGSSSGDGRSPRAAIAASFPFARSASATR